ncbi:MAG: DUF547 domain-containing protein [Bacteroidota bacterium]
MNCSHAIKINAAIGFFLFFNVSLFSQGTFVEKSTALMNAVRYGKETATLLKEIAEVDAELLASELNNDNARKTFWINIYNAHIQLFLNEDPALYEDRWKFFKTERIKVAGEILDFDIIEHGIIRRSKAKLGLGIFPNLFPSKIERMFRIKKTDPRIHMALNCGAKSCPPVAVYEYEKLDAQLEESTRRLLAQSTVFNEQTDQVEVIALFSWFRGDWGNKNKVRKFLKKYEAIPADSNPTIKYSKYDWTLLTGNYIDLDNGGVRR